MNSVVERFEKETDGELRIVAWLDSTSYEFEYIREDLEDRYSSEDFEEMYLSIMGNMVSADDFSQTTAVGSIEAQILVLGEIVVFLFPSSRYEAVFISFDRRESLSVLEVLDIANEFPELLQEA